MMIYSRKDVAGDEKQTAILKLTRQRRRRRRRRQCYDDNIDMSEKKSRIILWNTVRKNYSAVTLLLAAAGLGGLHSLFASAFSYTENQRGHNCLFGSRHETAANHLRSSHNRYHHRLGVPHPVHGTTAARTPHHLPDTKLWGWIQGEDGEWEWEEDDPNYDQLAADTATGYTPNSSPSPSPSPTGTNNGNDAKLPPIMDDGIEEALRLEKASSGPTPKLPRGTFRPKQSLGQNFLRDPNTVLKIIRAYAKDATETIRPKTNVRTNNKKERGNDNHGTTSTTATTTTMIGEERPGIRVVELGPGAGALTNPLIETFGIQNVRCIEIDDRSVQLLHDKYPTLRIIQNDVLQVDYVQIAQEAGGPLSIVGNLPYYITSQILFALADASHFGAVRSATVTMQYEVAKRIVAPTKCKDYGILSVVFQLYADCTIHFKIPPTVFYPQPKVDSALVGLRFIGPDALRRRLGGVRPSDLRRVLASAFRQRRKIVRNGLKTLASEIAGGDEDRAGALLSPSDSPPPPPPPAGEDEGEDEFVSARALPPDWSLKRPEELSPGQFVELTRLLFGPKEGGDTADAFGRNERVDASGGRHRGGGSTTTTTATLGKKVWRKLKHGSN